MNSAIVLDREFSLRTSHLIEYLNKLTKREKAIKDTFKARIFRNRGKTNRRYPFLKTIRVWTKKYRLCLSAARKRTQLSRMLLQWTSGTCLTQVCREILLHQFTFKVQANNSTMLRRVSSNHYWARELSSSLEGLVVLQIIHFLQGTWHRSLQWLAIQLVHTGPQRITCRIRSSRLSLEVAWKPRRLPMKTAALEQASKCCPQLTTSQKVTLVEIVE